MPSNFPTRAPTGLIFGMLLAFLAGFPILVGWYHYQPALERFYLGEYVSTTVSQTSVGAVLAFFHKSPKRTYYVLQQGGQLLTASDRLIPGHLSVRYVTARPVALNRWLQANVYAGRGLASICQTPALAWIATSLSILLAGLTLDFQRRKRAREGLKLRGPDLMTRAEFNRVTQGDGLKIYVKD